MIFNIIHLGFRPIQIKFLFPVHRPHLVTVSSKYSIILYSSIISDYFCILYRLSAFYTGSVIAIVTVSAHVPAVLSSRHKWLMTFNLSKCEHLTLTNKHSPILSDYHIDGCTINKVSSCKYLGVTITNNLSWSKHIANVVNKAHSVRGFLQRNLRQCSISVKSKAYLALVRPIVEYASVIWSLYTNCDKTVLEGVLQREVVRFVCNDFSTYSSVTSMLNNLSGTLWKIEGLSQDLLCSIKLFIR